MIIAHANAEDTLLLIVGLSRGNIDRLVAGEPIYKRADDTRVPGLSLAVLFGETEEDILRQLADAGFGVETEGAKIGTGKHGP